MENYENQNSVELLLNEIDKSVEHKQYLIALFATLTIPDILGKVKYPNALGNKKRYVKWFDENIKDSFEAIIGIENTIKMDGTACFRLRNALLHGGDNVLNNDPKIDEFVLVFSDEDFVRGDYAGTDWYEKGEEPKNPYLYVGCKELCRKIVVAAKEFIRNNPDLDYPTIRMNNGGGRINKCLIRK